MVLIVLTFHAQAHKKGLWIHYVPWLEMTGRVFLLELCVFLIIVLHFVYFVMRMEIYRVSQKSGTHSFL